jgi:hypothetical protein
MEIQPIYHGNQSSAARTVERFSKLLFVLGRESLPDLTIPGAELHQEEFIWFGGSCEEFPSSLKEEEGEQDPSPHDIAFPRRKLGLIRIASSTTH